tara:strand:- start:1149 stop:1910 length:762 start_codon:yes stop_codon:yes gene_type:complete
MHDITLISITIFFVTGAFAGMVDTIAGGGGLIAVPVMLMMGVPPVATLGTNRMQSVIGEVTASVRFYRSNHLNLKRLLPGIICTGLGGFAGSIVLALIHAAILSKLIPFLLLIILLYMAFSPRPNEEDCHPRLPDLVFFVGFGFAIGFYNGFFGPATGSFWVIALMFFLGMHLQRAVIHAKPLNTIGNLGSLVYLIAIGKVVYWIVLCMGAGQILGAILGSHIVMHRGSKFIKPFFIIVVMIMTISLFIENYG